MERKVYNPENLYKETMLFCNTTFRRAVSKDQRKLLVKKYLEEKGISPKVLQRLLSYETARIAEGDKNMYFIAIIFLIIGFGIGIFISKDFNTQMYWCSIIACMAGALLSITLFAIFLRNRLRRFKPYFELDLMLIMLSVDEYFQAKQKLES